MQTMTSRPSLAAQSAQHELFSQSSSSPRTSVIARKTGSDTVQFSGWFKKKPPQESRLPLTEEQKEALLLENTRQLRDLRRALFGGLLIMLGNVGLDAIITKPSPERLQVQGFVPGSMEPKILAQREVLGSVLKESARELDAQSRHFTRLREYVNPAVVVLTGNDQIGSGWVYHSDGIIVTNAHVADNAKEGKLGVILLDGAQLTGQVIGANTDYDIAVVKVDAQYPLPTLSLRKNAPPGEQVMSAGHPFGLGWSTSNGTLSGENRNLSGNHPVWELMQTDASLAPGNSGGPLVNMRGEVVGMNQTIAKPGQGELGFSIPAETVERVVKQILNHPDVKEILNPTNKAG